MHRLFVAIRPPAPIRAQLMDMMGGVVGVRWQDDEQLHLTLRFIGEVDRHCAEDIAIALSNISVAQMQVTLRGVGTFDRRGRVDTLWAGAGPAAPLGALHAKIDHALVRLGLEPDRRAYHPHVTLARCGRCGPLDGFLAANAGFVSAPFDVTHFGLFESTLGSEGARYTLVERYPLA